MAIINMTYTFDAPRRISKTLSSNNYQPVNKLTIFMLYYKNNQKNFEG